jgi:hypothetical protein
MKREEKSRVTCYIQCKILQAELLTVAGRKEPVQGGFPVNEPGDPMDPVAEPHGPHGLLQPAEESHHSGTLGQRHLIGRK